jgi:hypothetical protein
MNYITYWQDCVMDVWRNQGSFMFFLFNSSAKTNLMPPYMYLVFIALGLILLYCIRLLVGYQSNISTAFFIEAIKEENNGRYEEALVNYQSALDELERIHDHSSMKYRVIEKKKLMYTIIEYKKNSSFVRQINLN